MSAPRIVKEITQPAHNADGGVAYRPGEQFGEDEELPEGVRYRLAVAQEPDPPAPAPRSRRTKQATTTAGE